MAKRDASKERFWRRLVRERSKTGETVASLCAREGVPVHQFYWWQRTLRTRQRSTTSQRRDGRRGASETDQASKSFVPVRVPLVTQTPVEVFHPGGCMVRVPAGIDPHSLRQILAALDPSADGTEG